MQKIKKVKKTREVLKFIALSLVIGFSLLILLMVAFCRPLYIYDTVLANLGSGAVISTIAYLILKYA